MHASYHAGEQALTALDFDPDSALVRTVVAGMIQVPENKIRIVAPESAAASDRSLTSMPRRRCAATWHRLGRRLKWIEDSPGECVCHDSWPRPDLHYEARSKGRHAAASRP